MGRRVEMRAQLPVEKTIPYTHMRLSARKAHCDHVIRRLPSAFRVIDIRIWGRKPFPTLPRWSFPPPVATRRYASVHRLFSLPFLLSFICPSTPRKPTYISKFSFLGNSWEAIWRQTKCKQMLRSLPFSTCSTSVQNLSFDTSKIALRSPA